MMISKHSSFSMEQLFSSGIRAFGCVHRVTVLIFSAGFPTYAQGAFPFDFLSSPCFHCRRDFPVAKFTSAADSFLLRRSQSSIRCLRSCLVRAQNRASLGSSSADIGAGQVSVCGPAGQVPISSGRSRFCSESVFSCVPRPRGF
jgi:hypothetical protein